MRFTGVLLMCIPITAVAGDQGLEILQPNAQLEAEILEWQTDKRACYAADDIASCMQGVLHDGAYVEGLTWNHRTHPELCKVILDEQGYLADDVASTDLEACLFAGEIPAEADKDPSSARRILHDCLLNGEPEFNPYFDRYVIYTSQVACSMDYRDGRWAITQMTVRG